MAHYVVIGAGQAGASLVARLRAGGFDGHITLIGEEPVPPYQRPPLTKGYLLGEMDEVRLYLRPKSWYAEQEVTLRTGVRVESVDAENQEITLFEGEKFHYDQLAFATGSRPRRLPESIGGALGGVYTVRDLADADAMAPEFTEGRRLLVVGGGYIGLEAAAVAAKRGLKVTLLEAAPRILRRVACEATADYFRALHIAHGVEVIEGVSLERLTGEGRVDGAVLSDGREIGIDFAVVGVGIEPATDLAEQAGIAVDNGIAVNAQGRTSVPNIWAAGDCASFPYRGARIRLESVGNAIDMAEAVAANMLGAGRDYEAKPWFWSDQYDCKLQIGGLNLGYDAVHVKRGAGDGVSHWYYRGEELIAVDAMNDARNYMIGKRLIEMGRSPAPEVLLDPATDMKALLKG